MTNRVWPDWLDQVWAKSPEKGVDKQAESLAQHTWNVLAKLSETIRLRPTLPGELGLPSLWNRLFWACWLHDFGKATKGFQNRLRGGDRFSHRHEVLSLAFLDWIASALTDEEQCWVAAGIAAHHQDLSEIRDKTYSVLWLSDENCLAAPVAEIPNEAIAGLWTWLHECTPSWIEALGLRDAGIRAPSLPSQADALRLIRDKGAERARYWLKAYGRFVDKIARSEEQALLVGALALRGYVIGADHSASAHIDNPPPSPVINPTRLIARLKIPESKLYEHQKACAKTRGSAVLIAPTGSGKTESALLWACAQAEEEHPVPRLFYTLPYQASMNAMYDRLNDKAFPHNVGLEHSRAVLALYRRLLDNDYTPEKAMRAAKASRDLARLNHYPVRVLSPYQILKAPYRLKGYEVLLSDFFDATFVLDEVHAYEPDRLAMILATVKYLRQSFGARFFVMSATLPGLLRSCLVEALGEHAIIQASDGLFAEFQRHRLHLLDGDLLDEHGIKRIVDDARRGQAVLVCCNTVKRAQQAYELLQGWIPSDQILLLHGRFNGRDRLAKEKTVCEATGSESEQRRPLVLVATQVVEVSLDIDLDVIYTDAAPLEALIQRFGRVNRRHLKSEAPVHVFSRPCDGQRIYPDDLVAASLQLIARNADRMIVESEISGWLDDIYQGDIASRWQTAFRTSYDEFTEACLRTLRAFDASTNLESEFYKAFDSIDVLPACLAGEYDRLKDELPLEASQLLVPIRWGQFCRLQSKGLVRPPDEDTPRVVAATYSPETGLTVQS